MYLSATLQTEMGPATIYEVPHTTPGEGDTLALVLGEFATMADMPEGPLVRMHSRCDFAEVLESTECECGPQLLRSRELMVEEGAGILFYFNDHEGRGAGLSVKTRGCKLTHELGVSTVEAYAMMGVPVDQREYTHVPPFLQHFAINKVRLLTNHPAEDLNGVASKWGTLVRAGIQVVRVPLIIGRNPKNETYLNTKRDVLGHHL